MWLLGGPKMQYNLTFYQSYSLILFYFIHPSRLPSFFLVVEKQEDKVKDNKNSRVVMQ